MAGGDAMPLQQGERSLLQPVSLVVFYLRGNLVDHADFEFVLEAGQGGSVPT